MGFSQVVVYIHSSSLFYFCLTLYGVNELHYGYPFNDRRKPGQNLDQVLSGIWQADSKIHTRRKKYDNGQAEISAVGDYLTRYESLFHSYNIKSGFGHQKDK